MSTRRVEGWSEQGAPTTGFWTVGDFVYDVDGTLWKCTVAGTPGTWVETQSGAYEALDPDALTAGETTIRRTSVSSNGVTLGASGTMRLKYFTARRTETITQLSIPTGGTAAAATPTLCRAGIYTVAANGDITLAAAIASDTALWASTFTAYTRSLTASLSKVAGQRYALGIIVVSGAALPSFCGANGLNPGTEHGRAPVIAGSVPGQADLPASVVAASIGFTNNMIYGVLLP